MMAGRHRLLQLLVRTITPGSGVRTNLGHVVFFDAWVLARK